MAAKTTPATAIKHGTDDQDQASAVSIGMGRQPERDQGVADQGERENQADRHPVEAASREVQGEDHGKEAVAEHADDAGCEQEPAVAVESAQGLGEPCRWRDAH